MTIINERYELRHRIGEGAAGIVLYGYDRVADLPVAIKLLKFPEDLLDSKMVERFRRETQTVKQLDHPNIVKVFDIVQEGEQRYLIMEYVDGHSLANRIAQPDPMPILEILNIALDVADALTLVHRRGIVHRDLKPANILLSRDGTPRIADFGLVRLGGETTLTETGEILGTPLYMPPEALAGEPATEHIDIWAFGVTLFEMISGKNPFSRSDIVDSIQAIMNAELPNVTGNRADVPPVLVHLVQRILVKNPGKRISSMWQIESELHRILESAEIVDGVLRFPAMHNLPAPTESVDLPDYFIEGLRQLIRQNKASVITLTEHNSEQTAVAVVEAARGELASFRDGVFIFAGVENELLSKLLTELHAGSLDTTYHNARSALFEYLSGKHMLLIIDGLTRSYESIDLVQEMVSKTPSLRIIVLSDKELGLDDEFVVGKEYFALKTAEYTLRDRLKAFTKDKTLLSDQEYLLIASLTVSGRFKIPDTAKVLWRQSQQRILRRLFVSRMLFVILISFVSGAVVTALSLLVEAPGRGIDFLYATIILMIVMKGHGALAITASEYMNLTRFPRLIAIPLFSGLVIGSFIAILATFGEPMTWFSDPTDAFWTSMVSGIFLGLTYHYIHLLDQRPFFFKRLWRIVAGVVVLSIPWASLLTALRSYIAPGMPIEAIWITLPVALLVIAVLFSIGLNFAELLTFETGDQQSI